MSFASELADYAKRVAAGNKPEFGKIQKASWLSGYGQGSFRGAEFFITSAQNEFGRRFAVHEFPQRDFPIAEDLGRKARKFTMTAYIVGDNYFDNRNRLIEALELPGIGKFVHPYLGVFNAVALNSSMTESTNEGRIARFTITFQEQIETVLTSSGPDAKTKVYNKRKDFLDNALAFFEDAYDIAQAPVQVVQNVLDEIDRALDVIVAAKKVVGSVADFQRELSNVRGKLTQLVFDATDLWNDIAGIVTFGTDILDGRFSITPANARQQYIDFNEPLNQFKADTDTTDPVDLIRDMFYKQSLISALGLLPDVDYTSLEDADALFADGNAGMDQIELDPASSDELIADSRDMRAALQEDIDDRTANLGQIYNYVVPKTSKPTIAISSTIYGDIDREQEIIDRNKVQNPFFAGGSLSVVVNDNG